MTAIHFSKHLYATNLRLENLQSSYIKWTNVVFDAALPTDSALFEGSYWIKLP